MQREGWRGGESAAQTETETCEGTRPGGTEKAEREQGDAVEQPWAVCKMPGDGSGQLQCVRARASGCVCICGCHFHKPASLPGLSSEGGAMRKPRLRLAPASSALSFLRLLSLSV